jgi:hypothetical protein
VSGRLYALDGKRASRRVRVDAAELAELRRTARKAAAAYHAGFLDGRDRLAGELGVTLPPRVRSGEDRAAAEHAAAEENIIRLIYRSGYADGMAAALGTRGRDASPRRHLRSAGGRPGGAA